MNIPQRRRLNGFYLLLFFSVIIAASLLSAFLLRYNFSLARNHSDSLIASLYIAVGVKIFVFSWFRLHQQWWEYVSFSEALRVTVINCFASILFLAITFAMELRLGASVYLIDLGLCTVTTIMMVFSLRVRQEIATLKPHKEVKNILIYGAGSAGITLVREIRSDRKSEYHVLGFIDDDSSKVGATFYGVKVVGIGRDVAIFVEKHRRRGQAIDEIVIAMPTLSGDRLQETLANCRNTGIPCKILPSLQNILSQGTLKAQIREIEISDLLGRKPVQLETTKIRAEIFNRSVLVSGGAGSIGSELCRQIASFSPKRLVIFDQAESDLFRIDSELRNRYPELEIIPSIGDIRDRTRVDDVFSGNHIELVFHAAAYKHVPLMEANILEAALNNILGTWNLVRSALRHNVDTFVTISSDKAVNPTNVMGATKRVSELIAAACSHRGTTRFVSVRFGNVLGSNGSVVEIFKKQIAGGGPITITHPDIRRFFMTIPEATQLVLQASTMSKGSEIFVLEMGNPVKIIDLAKSMIRLSGKTENEIEIKISGLRPGEKLYEELCTDLENVIPTYHEKIKIFESSKPTEQELIDWIADLDVLIQKKDELGIARAIYQFVPEWAPSERWKSIQQSTYKPTEMKTTSVI